jgi:hypothetical protein
MSDYGSPPPPPPPPPSGGPGAVDHPKGMTILILGILSLVCCSPLGIAAWLMGNSALKEIDAQPGRYANRQIVQIGRILGIIGTVILVLTVIWFLFLGGLAAVSGGFDSSM